MAGQWHVKATGAYGRTSSEAEDIAKIIYDITSALGWNLVSTCAMLGNMEHESGYNAWRWQSDIVLPVGDSRIGSIGGGNTAHAYGLCQQDPAAKYIYREYAQRLSTYGPNYSDRTGNQRDGEAQLYYLDWICEQNASGGEWLPDASSTYGMTFQSFKQDTTHDINFLTHTFFHCYERGTWSDTRSTAAQYWYNKLGGYTPEPPAPPESPAIWYAVFSMLRRRKINANIYIRNKGGRTIL